MWSSAEMHHNTSYVMRWLRSVDPSVLLQKNLENQKTLSRLWEAISVESTKILVSKTTPLHLKIDACQLDKRWGKYHIVWHQSILMAHLLATNSTAMLWILLGDTQQQPETQHNLKWSFLLKPAAIIHQLPSSTHSLLVTLAVYELCQNQKEEFQYQLLNKIMYYSKQINCDINLYWNVIVYVSMKDHLNNKLICLIVGIFYKQPWNLIVFFWEFFLIFDVLWRIQLL